MGETALYASRPCRANIAEHSGGKKWAKPPSTHPARVERISQSTLEARNGRNRPLRISPVSSEYRRALWRQEMGETALYASRPCRANIAEHSGGKKWAKPP